jgi:hypothetical protein
MKTARLKWQVVDDLAISFATEGKLRDDEWAQLIQAIKTKAVTRYLNLSVGSVEVNSIQRKAMIDVLNAKKISVVVVTDDSIVRGLVTAANWLGVNVKAFSWKESEKGVVALGFTDASGRRILQVVHDLKVGT